MKNITEVKLTKAEIYQQFNKWLEYTGEDGKGGTCRKNIYLLKDGKPEYLQDLIREAHSGDLPNDFIYDTIANFVYAVMDKLSNDGNDDNQCLSDFEEEARDETEADIYTSDLTNWLNSHNSNVYYLTEAIEIYGCKDGFELLQLAQLEAKKEAIANFMAAIEKIVD